MTVCRHCLVAIVWAAAVCASAPAWCQDVTASPPATREITAVRGDLYLVRDGQQCTVFLATPDGIILGDPLSQATASWLRDEIKARFGQQVRFVLHTSHNDRRAAGSSVFNDTAKIVAHGTFNAELAKARREQPERYRFALRIEQAYSGKRLITLAGRTVAMVHVPTPRAPEMTVLHYPRERIAFASDFPAIATVPISFKEFEPSDVFAWIDTLAGLDFDSLLLGDGRTVSRAQFDVFATYVLALRRAVLRGFHEERTLAQMKSSAALEEFRSNPHYAERASQLSDLYSSLRSVTFRVSAGPATSYTQLSSEFCASRTTCTGGGGVAMARFTMSMPVRARLDLTAELTLGRQEWSARTSAEADQEAATRRTRGTALIRYAPRGAKFSYAFVAGPSLTFVDVQGIDRVKGVLAPRGGIHRIDDPGWRIGLTVGGDLERRLGNSLAVRLPIRLTRTFNPAGSAYPESALDLQAGIDITFRLLHRASFR